MNQILRGALLLFFVLSSPDAFPQNHVEQYFNALRKNQAINLEKEVQLLSSDRTKWSAIVAYQNDSISHVRYQAHLLLARLGQKSKNQQDRSWIVDQLIRSNRNTDSGLVGLVVRELSAFNRDDFSSASRDSLRSMVRQKAKHYSFWLRLVGYVGLKDQIALIRSQLVQNQLNRSEKWSAYLALSRLGDSEALQYVLGRVRSFETNDEVVYEVFPDLVYTRQPLAMQLLVEALQSNEPDCQSADAENPQPQTCAYRIMELLAPVIKNIPLKMDPSGDLSITDYKLALQSTREWFRNHPDYKIVDDSI
ncbi:MAG: hypothetical protein ACK5RG_14965 [Cyclobacteriaceae bacterium]|jgi:hypothetical protein|nr:hypothetical protein [Flammeovirgaceae bacterium]